MSSFQSPPDEGLGHCLVTGAAGFLGRHLVRALLRRGYRVRALIHHAKLTFEDPGLEIVHGAIEDGPRMLEVCADIDSVFHTAASMTLFGGRAVSEPYRHASYATNVEGTKNVIAACQQRGVSRLVHTSSIDVCFNAAEDMHVDSRSRYATKLDDLYTETKILAERAVLEANDNARLLTTALRPDGIYGAESNIMLDRLFEQLVTGRFVATIGRPGGTHDHVYIDNLVHAELLAAEHLMPGSPVCGKAYFVGDGRPMPMFEFFRPMTEALGYQMPKIDIPAKPVMIAMRLWQYLHFKLGVPRPIFTPHELAKLTISQCGTNEEANRDFGYEPIVSAEDAMSECIAYYERKLLAETA
ncbi:MAG TPA: NAD-dependent epimerase/dehydratase family protein [Polyangiales bacterium]|nr:NAD-dependent epimerase/dehydratase family protein [Polyangiales bacterium]